MKGKTDFYEPYGQEPGYFISGVYDWTATKD